MKSVSKKLMDGKVNFINKLMKSNLEEKEEVSFKILTKKDISAIRNKAYTYILP